MRLVTELVTIFKRSGNFLSKIAASFVLFTLRSSLFSELKFPEKGLERKEMVVLLRKVGFDISGLNRGT